MGIVDVTEALRKRRAYRSLAPVEITEDLIQKLAESVRMAPSCSNSQPWRFVFVYEPSLLIEMQGALSSGNRWAHKASLIIAVFSKAEDDCQIRDRRYHQFDTGIGVGFLLLRATELGLVAHPIAGFSPKKTRAILGIPEEYEVITLIIVGSHADALDPGLSEDQRAKEIRRPVRKRWEEFVYLNRFK